MGTVKLVYFGELLRMGGDTIRSVFPVQLVDNCWGRVGQVRMFFVATGKRNMFKAVLE